MDLNGITRVVRKFVDCVRMVHVRRDFVKVGKGWPKHKEWALAWLRLIRELYHHNRLRLAAAAYRTADAELRRVASTMQAMAVAELDTMPGASRAEDVSR